MLSRYSLLALAGLLSLFILAGFTLGSDGSVHQWITQSILWLQNNGFAGQALFVLAMVIVSSTGILPSSIVAAAAGSVFGLWTGLALVSGGIFIGAITAFSISRYVVRTPIESALKKRVSLDTIDRLVGERGCSIVILLRLSPVVPFVIGSYALGITSVRFRDYCLGTVGVIPPLFAIVYTGSLAGNLATLYNSAFSEWNLVQYAAMAAGLIATIGIVMLLSRIARQTLNNALRNGSRDQAGSGPTTANSNRPE